MNFLLIQERGRHEENEDFREALSMLEAIRSLGHSGVVWGLGYGTFQVQPIQSFWGEYDVIFLLEQYEQTPWIPDLSSFKGPRVFWTIDSHCNLAEHQAQVKRQKITHLLSSTAAYLDAYEAPVKVWFPNCYDDTLIYPMPYVEKVHPIGFCGNDNGRIAWLDFISQQTGISTKRDVFVIGEAMVKAINSYQIHFNRNIRDDINYRTQETAGCATMLLTNYTPGLETLFDIGKEIVTYSGEEDLIQKVRHYLGNPDECEAIAAAGYARAKRDHTYLARAKQLLEILK